jgi:hypothetical protein
MSRLNKRGDGSTINTIVVMALALVVLAVLLFLTYKYIVKPGEQAGNTGSCAGQGGQCKETCDDKTERGLLGLGCTTKVGTEDKSTWCCVPR